MPEHKYVVQLRVVGSNAPISTLLDTLDSGEASEVWAGEHTITEGETEDGTPMLTAHVPYYAEEDADGAFETLRGIQGMLNSADDGYLHVHECVTGGSPEAWDCGEHVLREETV